MLWHTKRAIAHSDRSYSHRIHIPLLPSPPPKATLLFDLLTFHRDKDHSDKKQYDIVASQHIPKTYFIGVCKHIVGSNCHVANRAFPGYP